MQGWSLLSCTLLCRVASTLATLKLPKLKAVIVSASSDRSEEELGVCEVRMCSPSTRKGKRPLHGDPPAFGARDRSGHGILIDQRQREMFRLSAGNVVLALA